MLGLILVNHLVVKLEIPLFVGEELVGLLGLVHNIDQKEVVIVLKSPFYLYLNLSGKQPHLSSFLLSGYSQKYHRK